MDVSFTVWHFDKIHKTFGAMNTHKEMQRALVKTFGQFAIDNKFERNGFNKWTKGCQDISHEIIVTLEKYPRRLCPVFMIASANIGIEESNSGVLLHFDHETIFPYHWRGALDGALRLDGDKQDENEIEIVEQYLHEYIAPWFNRWQSVADICHYLNRTANWEYLAVGWVSGIAERFCNVQRRPYLPSELVPKVDIETAEALRRKDKQAGFIRV